MKKSLSILLLAAAGVTGANAQFSNPGFETGDFTGWTLGGPALALSGSPMPDSSTTLPEDGNQFIGVGAAIAPGVYPPNSGNFASYFFGGAFNADGSQMTSYYTLSQTIATTPGLEYAITLFVANDTDPDPTHQAYNEITGTFGSGVSLLVFDMPGSPNASTYTPFTFEGVATSSLTTLTLNIDNQSGYFDVDDISAVAGVPEPASLLLIGPALGGLLYAARRRRKA